MRFTHRTFNALVARRRRNRVIAVIGQPGSTWKHPWQCTVNNDGQNWNVTIQPGFVNGLTPTVPLPTGSPSTGSPSTGAPSTVPLLTARLPWRLSAFRDIGPGAAAVSFGTDGENLVSTYEPVPEYFRALGVGPAPTAARDGLNTVITGTAQDKERERGLKACEVILSQDFRGMVRDEDGKFIPGPTPKRRRPYLDVRAAMPITVVSDLLFNTTLQHLATIYLMSPPGAGSSSSPDASWTPFVKHRTWRNLNHDVNVALAPIAPLEIKLPKGLAGGAGDALIQSLVDLALLADQFAIDQLTGSPVTGKFWTRYKSNGETEIPSTINPQLSTVPPDPYGIESAARINAANATEAAAQKALPLEPSFPWRGERFDPRFFGFARL